NGAERAGAVGAARSGPDDGPPRAVGAARTTVWSGLERRGPEAARKTSRNSPERPGGLDRIDGARPWTRAVIRAPQPHGSRNTPLTQADDLTAGADPPIGPHPDMEQAGPSHLDPLFVGKGAVGQPAPPLQP